MLSLNEIRNVHFRTSNFRGYKAEDVEAFIDEVQQSYDQLLKENADLQKKVDVLAQKLEEYQHEEDAIRSALMNAQKLGDASLRDAKHKSEIILKDATIKAEKIVSNAQSEIKREKEIVDRMQKDVSDFKTNLLKLYKEHLQIINNIRSEDVLRQATREAAQSVQIINPQFDSVPPPQQDLYSPMGQPEYREPTQNPGFNPFDIPPEFPQNDDGMGGGFNAPPPFNPAPQGAEPMSGTFGPPPPTFENTFSRNPIPPEQNAGGFDQNPQSQGFENTYNRNQNRTFESTYSRYMNKGFENTYARNKSFENTYNKNQNRAFEGTSGSRMQGFERTAARGGFKVNIAEDPPQNEQGFNGTFNPNMPFNPTPYRSEPLNQPQYPEQQNFGAFNEGSTQFNQNLPPVAPAYPGPFGGGNDGSFAAPPAPISEPAPAPQKSSPLGLFRRRK
ncbi:MAG: DivIVA domain-containing protein [Oscillospiraceae bacterium]|jgi:cell division initiation protein|nr:DivIVA domain-containing protein [Oscillospiraceae bacterium]